MVSVEPAAMIAVEWIKLGDQSPEVTTVIALTHMADFMNDDIVYDLVRGHNELAIEAEPIGSRATAPDGGDFLDIYPGVVYSKPIGVVIDFFGDDSNTSFEIETKDGFPDLRGALLARMTIEDRNMKVFSVDFGFCSKGNICFQDDQGVLRPKVEVFLALLILLDKNFGLFNTSKVPLDPVLFFFDKLPDSDLR